MSTMKTVKGEICTECGHDHWCYCCVDEEESEDNVGYTLCCECDKRGKTATMLHKPVYAD